MTKLICDICKSEKAKYHFNEHTSVTSTVLDVNHVISSNCSYYEPAKRLDLRPIHFGDIKICEICLINKKLIDMNIQIPPKE